MAQGQAPRVLFVTCSDSRLDPNLVTQAELGELFVIRNAGNIIPPYGATNGGEGASVEYAVQALGIEQIIICGHSHCGAMKGLFKLDKLEHDMPLVYNWLKHTEATRRIVMKHYGHYSRDELVEIAVAENVLTQIANLETYPAIRLSLAEGKLKIYGWIYHIESGEILAYDAEAHAFLPPRTDLPDQDSPGVGQYLRTGAPPTPAHSSHGVLNSVRSPNSPWLSVEQAERIYRGSGNTQ
jgi:carbonic anhydrase